MPSGLRKAAAAKRHAHGAKAGRRRKGTDNGPPNAKSSRQKPNSNRGEGSGSNEPAAGQPTLPKLAPPRARRAVPVDEQHAAALAGERPGDGAADDPGADDGDRVPSGLWQHS